MASKPELKGRPNRAGIYIAAVYVIIALVVYPYHPNPDSLGYDSLPFIMLAMPWYAINSQLLFPGIFLNAGILYLLGWAFEKFRRWLFRK